MVFKRRNRRPVSHMLTDAFWPRIGWRRALAYVIHRLGRLPDAPHRVGRGVAAGVFISFTPFFGFHFIGAALIAWALRGSILAALFGTFFGNPMTTPIIAILSVSFGRWILGVHGETGFQAIIGAFSHASIEIWENIHAIFTPEPAQWPELGHFFQTIFLPYLVGGILPGLLAAVICHYLTLPVVAAYQKRRAKKMRESAERLRAAAAARLRGRDGKP